MFKFVFVEELIRKVINRDEYQMSYRFKKIVHVQKQCWGKTNGFKN